MSKSFKMEVVDLQNRKNLSDSSKVNLIYGLWKFIWKSEFQIDKFVDDFKRMEVALIITNDDHIVASHFYSSFNLRFHSDREHSYLKYFPDEFFKSLEEKNIIHVMSAESMYVDESFRGTGLSLILANLTSLYFLYSEFDGIVAPMNPLVGVSKIAEKLGWELLVKNGSYENNLADFGLLEKGNFVLLKGSKGREVMRIWRESDYFKKGVNTRYSINPLEIAGK